MYKFCEITIERHNAELTLKHAFAIDLGFVNGRFPVRRAFLLEAGVRTEGHRLLHPDALLLKARR